MEEDKQNPVKDKKVNAVDSLKEKFYSLIEKERLSKKSLSVKLAEIDRQKLKDLATEKGITYPRLKTIPRIPAKEKSHFQRWASYFCKESIRCANGLTE